MPRLLLLAAALPLASASGLRGKSWPWDLHSNAAASSASAASATKSSDDIFGTKSDADAPTGDFMDQYIAATHKDGADAPKVWFRSDDNQAKKAQARSDLERPADHSYEPFRFHAEESSDDAMSKIHQEASRSRREAAPAAPAADAPADAPAERELTASGPPPMVTKRIEGGGGGGGAVVDVHLDSELQESLLQGNGKVHSKAKGVKGDDVAAEVNAERLQDVYIHDGFAEDAASDVKAEAEVHANKDMKA